MIFDAVERDLIQVCDGAGLSLLDAADLVELFRARRRGLPGWRPAEVPTATLPAGLVKRAAEAKTFAAAVEAVREMEAEEEEEKEVSHGGAGCSGEEKEEGEEERGGGFTTEARRHRGEEGRNLRLEAGGTKEGDGKPVEGVPGRRAVQVNRGPRVKACVGCGLEKGFGGFRKGSSVCLQCERLAIAAEVKKVGAGDGEEKVLEVGEGVPHRPAKGPMKPMRLLKVGEKAPEQRCSMCRQLKPIGFFRGTSMMCDECMGAPGKYVKPPASTKAKNHARECVKCKQFLGAVHFDGAKVAACIGCGGIAD